MPIFDGVNLTITLDSGLTDVDVIDNIYEPWKDWMLSSPLNRGYPPAFRSDGGAPLSSIINQGSYIFLNNTAGWRIKPPEEDITIYLTGNLAVEDTDFDAFLPTIGGYTAAILGLQPITQGVTPSMATQLEYASFGDVVTIDIINGVPGTGSYNLNPIGSKLVPSNNIADALTIAQIRGFNIFSIIGNITLSVSDFSNGFVFIGQSPQLSTITINTNANVTNCEFKNATIEGTLDGGNTITNCVVDDLNYVNGSLNECILQGTIILAGNTIVRLTGCSDGLAGVVMLPVIDCDGGGRDLIITDYDGSLHISNQAQSDNIEISIGRGNIHLHDTITGGNFRLSGIATLLDESTGTTINKEALMSKDTISDAVSDRFSDISILMESNSFLPGTGDIFYRDPTNGNDFSDGKTKTTAVQSHSAAEALIVDGNSDVLFLINTSGGLLQLDEQWDLQKAYSVRAPGAHSIELYPSSTSGPTIRARKTCDLHGFKVRTSTSDGLGGDQYCIDIDAGVNNSHFKRLKIANGIEGGIIFRDCDGSLIEDSVIEHFTGKVGIDYLGDSHENILRDNFIYDMLTGIRYQDTASENWINGRNLIHDMTTGVMIEDATVDHLYIDRATIFQNLDRHLNNDIGGTGIACIRTDEAAQAVDDTWDELLVDHSISGSVGESVGKLLGLTQENQFIDNTTYDGDDNLTAGRLRIYSVAGSVGTDSDVLATYNITATYTGGTMTDYKVVKA